MDTSTAKRDYSLLGWALFAMAAVSTGIQYLMSFLLDRFYPAFSRLPDSLWLWVMTFVPIYLAAMPAALLIMRKIPGDTASPVKMPRKQFLMLLLIGFPVMYAGNIIGILLSFLLSGGTAQNGLLEYINSSPAMTAILAVLIAPFAEEYIFRKQLIDRIARYGETCAIFVSALAFALFHMNLFQFFYAFGLGILLAYLYIRTRMLRYPVVLHMVINFMGSVLAPWILSLVDLELLDAAAAGTAAVEEIFKALPGLTIYLGYCGLLLILNAAGFVLLLIRWKKRVILPASRELAGRDRFRVIFANTGMILYTAICLGFTIWTLI